MLFLWSLHLAAALCLLVGLCVHAQRYTQRHPSSGGAEQRMLCLQHSCWGGEGKERGVLGALVGGAVDSSR